MRFLADENLDLSVIRRLRDAGHEVVAVAEMEPGISDELVLASANSLAATLITGDKDFGELAFRRSLVHCGVLLVRLAGLHPEAKAEILVRVIAGHGPELVGAFVVVSPGMVRIRRATLE